MSHVCMIAKIVYARLIHVFICLSSLVEVMVIRTANTASVLLIYSKTRRPESAAVPSKTNLTVCRQTAMIALATTVCASGQALIA